jgi:hypothetical protein
MWVSFTVVLTHLKLWRLNAKFTRREERQTFSNLHTYQASYGYTVEAAYYDHFGTRVFW